jgi:hypothetical protein
MGYQHLDYGSIYLFLNGFRISPYGEPENDWLGLDSRKSQGYNRYFGTREVIGRIEINSNNNSSWRVVSNREGLVQTPAYFQLIEKERLAGLFYRILRKLEVYVINGLDWDSFEDKGLYDRIVNAKKIDDVKLNYKLNDKEKGTRLISIISDILKAGSTETKNIKYAEFDFTLAEMLQQQHLDTINSFYESINNILGKSKEPKIFENNLYYFSELAKRAKEEHEKAQKALNEAAKAERRAAKAEEDARMAKLEAVKALSEARKAKEQVEQAEVRIKNVELQIQQKTTENLFLKAIQSNDIKDLIYLQHQVLIWIDGLKHKYTLMRREMKDNLKLLSMIYDAEELTGKIGKAAELITNSNLKINAGVHTLDIIAFISDYIDDYFYKDRIMLKNSLPNDEFKTAFKPLEITILIDNLISNSKKAV